MKIFGIMVTQGSSQKLFLLTPKSNELTINTHKDRTINKPETFCVALTISDEY